MWSVLTISGLFLLSLSGISAQEDPKTYNIADSLITVFNSSRIAPTIDRLLANENAVGKLTKCLLDLGECDEIGKFARGRIANLLLAKCDRCTPRQQKALKYVVYFLRVTNYERYDKVVDSYQEHAEYKPDFIAFFLQNVNISGLDVNELLAADTRSASIARCLLDLDTCDDLGYWLRARILATLEGRCERCTPRQLKVLQRIVGLIRGNPKATSGEDEEEGTIERILNSYRMDEPRMTDIFAIALQAFNVSNLNVDELLQAKTRRAAVGRCLLSLEECDKFGSWLRGRLSYFLGGECISRLCGRRLKGFVSRAAKAFKESEPDTYYPIYEAWKEDRDVKFDFGAFIRFLINPMKPEDPPADETNEVPVS